MANNNVNKKKPTKAFINNAPGIFSGAKMAVGKLRKPIPNFSVGKSLDNKVDTLNPVLQAFDPSKINKQKVKVQEARTATTTSPRTTSKFDSTSSSTNTLDTTTTSMPKYESSSPRTSSSGKSNKSGGKSFKPDGFKSDSLPKLIMRPVHTDHFNISSSDRSVYDIDKQSSPVTFNIDMVPTTTIKQNEIASVSVNNVEQKGRIHINLTSFADNLQQGNTTFAANTEFKADFLSIFSRYNTLALQKAKSGIISSWSVNNFADAMMNVCRALEYIHAIDSILAYSNSDPDKYDLNRTYYIYQSKIATAEVLLARDQLIKSVKGTWFPPNFAALLRWFYQSFKMADLPQSPLYRYAPGPAFCSATLSTSITNDLNYISTQLANNDYYNVYATLSMIFPEGVINEIPPSYSDVVFDPIHAEIFMNEPTVWNDGTTSRSYPLSLTQVNNDIPYYVDFTPNLTNKRGLAFGLQAINTNGTDTTGYTLKTTWKGLRKAITLGSAAATCNKFTIDIGSGSTCNFVKRASDWYAHSVAGDAHRVLYGNFDATTAKYQPYSTIPVGYQRAYFNNEIAPLVIFSDLLDKLFSLQ